MISLCLTAGMITGCNGNINMPEQPQGSETTPETTEMAAETGSQKPEEAVPEESSDTAAAYTAEEASDEITYKISSFSYSSGTDNFDGRTDLLEITGSGHEKLKHSVDEWFNKYKADFEKKCAEFEDEAKEGRRAYEEENSGSNENASAYLPYFALDYSVSVERADDGMLSLRLSEYSYSGGAHGSRYEYGANFDTQTGALIDNTEFNDSAASVREYIIKSIKASDKDVQDLLFPEWEDTINTIFASGMKDSSFWFDGSGMIYAFQQYDIVPYSEGIQLFEIPYGDMNGFPEKYTVDGEFFTTNISPAGYVKFIDLDGDGKEDRLWLSRETDENTYYSSYILHVNDKKLEVESNYYYYCAPKFVHSSEGNFFMLTVTSDNDYNTILMYSAEGDFQKIDELDGSFSSIEDGKAVISQRHDAFGTWTVYKNYTYDTKGFSTDETIDRLYNDPRTKENATGLTLLKDLKYSDISGDYTNTKTLEKGSVIYPVSDSGTELGFVTEDGKEGFFEYTYKNGDGGRKVDGVNEFDMFSELPYAG